MNSLKKLIDILDSMVDAHKHLLELTQEKRAILIGGDLQNLMQITHRENSIASEIEKLEIQRKQFVEEYLTTKGYTGTSFTLEEIIKRLNEASIEATLTTIGKQLRSIVQEISTVNKGNQQLIETSLAFLQYSINLLVPKDAPVGYGPKAKNKYASLLDAKV
ncbi:flagellar protein FlgN [Bacillus sp. DNRA2]|uniref:flagellar protein FlgN n=1 Tax=Bacillus sp. DNRA2 TaxID=2723053 RepID=UPI00145D50AD|nr:flagellar protein FlgN [Bacillus sp. DNRA2]NMD69080.1 flagellar protein FlgN [Bacillus sp. DNRA2]